MKQASLLLAAMCILIIPLVAQATISENQAINLVTQKVLKGNTDNVVMKIWGPISAGTDIRATKGSVLTASSDCYAVYIDDYPTANLFHPVHYALVNAETGELTVKEAMSPPLNEQDYRLVETAISRILMSAENRRPPLGKVAPNSSRSNRWAVLMNGGYNSGNNHIRYWNDLSNIYVTLNSTYGFADDHIIVLCSDGLDPAPDQSNGQNSNPDLDGDGDDDIMYPCLLSNVDAVFGQLATLLTLDDKLFVFTTDHGSSAGGWNTIQNLWNMENLTDAHFAALLDALPDCEIICTFEPCYSGGFLDNVVVPPGPRVASSACNYDQVSWAMPPDYVYDTYVFHWTAAAKGADAYGVPVNADYNSDGVVTMDEAYRYGETHDQSDEDPQYDDEPNGVGAGLSLWPSGPGPYLVISDKTIDDIGGNNNGAADPGETISMILELTNVGSDPATNIVGTLTTTDPYVTITQNTANYPDLAHFQQGQGTPAYMLDISSTCPQGQTVICNLHLTADTSYTADIAVSFVVGNPIYLPTGPDAYGYYAFDNLDQPSGPQYNWLEIAPAAGGPGSVVTALQGYDDRSVLIDMPFAFSYYGQNFYQLTICTNGWIAMGNATNDSTWTNAQIPNTAGPPNMIAPFWHDMNLETGGQIATYYDTAAGKFIIEFYQVPHWSPATALETFEIVFYNPTMYPTPTGDGQILFQYAQVTDASGSTVGIENSTETIGLQYLYNASYDEHAAPLQPGRAILFKTINQWPNVNIALTRYTPPTQSPIEFNIAVANNDSIQVTPDVWCMARLPNGTLYGPLLGPVNLTMPPGFSTNRNRSQNVPASAPAGNYQYIGYIGIYPNTIWDADSFLFQKLANGVNKSIKDWQNIGEEFGKK